MTPMNELKTNNWNNLPINICALVLGYFDPKTRAKLIISSSWMRIKVISFDITIPHNSTDEILKKILNGCVTKCICHLHIPKCRISNNAMIYISSLISLQQLNIYDCNEITDEGILHISSLMTLQQLDISWCNKITDEGMRHISSLMTLQQLYISRYY